MTQVWLGFLTRSPHSYLCHSSWHCHSPPTASSLNRTGSVMQRFTKDWPAGGRVILITTQLSKDSSALLCSPLKFPLQLSAILPPPSLAPMQGLQPSSWYITITPKSPFFTMDDDSAPSAFQSGMLHDTYNFPHLYSVLIEGLCMCCWWYSWDYKIKTRFLSQS